MHVLRRPPDQHPRRASGCPEGVNRWRHLAGQMRTSPAQIPATHQSGCNTGYGVRHARGRLAQSRSVLRGIGSGYSSAMSNITLIIVIVLAVVLIVIVGYQIMARQRRTRQLREQYGPEYDRVVDLADSQHEAESELRGRSKRHEQLGLRSLDTSERENFERCWSDIQGQFVDDPSTAVRNADLLVVEVMSPVATRSRISTSGPTICRCATRKVPSAIGRRAVSPRQTSTEPSTPRIFAKP